MATTYKNAQIAAAASDTATYATVYTCPAATTAVVSTITACNTSSSPVLVRLGVMASAGTPAVASGQFIWYDATIAANDTLAWTVGMVVTAGQYVRASASSTAVNFMASLSEMA